MGFFSKLFGSAETPEQRIERARFHFDEQEYELVVRTLRDLTTDDATALRKEAIAAIESRDTPRATSRKPEWEVDARDRDLGWQTDVAQLSQQSTPDATAMTLQFGADGSLRVGGGSGGSITLNAPRSDDNGKPRSTNGVAVAHSVLAAVREEPFEDPRAFTFVDAAFLVARSGSLPPRMTDPRRQVVLDLAVAASAADTERFVATLRTTSQDTEHVGRHAIPMAVAFAARELGELARNRRIVASVQLVRALIRRAPDLCDRIAADADDPLFAGEVVVAAAVVGADAPQAMTRWGKYTEMTQGADRDAWRALAIRRLACTDLEAALALFDSEERYDVDPAELGFDLAQRLARIDLPGAVARVRALSPHLDHAGWFAGVVNVAGDRAVELVDEWLAALHPTVYHPFDFFQTVLEACIRLEDNQRVRRCLEVAGPNGWQIACAARSALSLAGDRAALLKTLYRRVAAGFVSARASTYGQPSFGFGTRVYQPTWLTFQKPHPIETLAMVAELGESGPRWVEA